MSSSVHVFTWEGTWGSFRIKLQIFSPVKSLYSTCIQLWKNFLLPLFLAHWQQGVVHFLIKSSITDKAKQYKQYKCESNCNVVLKCWYEMFVFFWSTCLVCVCEWKDNQRNERDSAQVQFAFIQKNKCVLGFFVTAMMNWGIFSCRKCSHYITACPRK